MNSKFRIPNKKMNERSTIVLEYPKIINTLSGYCVTGGGKAQANQLMPMIYIGEIERELDLTDEAVGMVLRNGRPPLGEVDDVDVYVERANIGAMLSMKELLAISSMLRVVRDLRIYEHEDTQRETLKALKGFFEELDDCELLEGEISRKILTEDEMADNASVELKRIRREIVVKSGRISEKLNGIITSSANDKILQEKLITMRNNRYVVPVKQEYRSAFPGIVLDKSSSGATLFIEPMSVVQLNNDLKELAIEEEKEMIRILKMLSAKVRLMSEVLKADYNLLSTLDFIFAKASYALDLGGERVKLTEDGPIKLLKARHPLIPKDVVVASDIFLPEQVNTLIITGPNTGGKTVTLKTLGLLTLMAQSGLFIPVAEGSFTRVFRKVFADIGDEQSIEQSLSTFSSHMSNIVSIMDQCDETSLVLFDELGAGTDPTEGAALAIAILDELHNRGGITAATTHYSELKEYALVEPGIVNASVEFDVETLRPTYRLQIGIPGKSNAFQIAARLGLSDAVINAARGKIEEGSLEFEETLEKIEEKRVKAEKDAAETKRLKEEAFLMRQQAEKDREAMQKQYDEMIEKAKAEAEKIILETKKQTEAIYKEIRLIQESTVAGVKDNKQLEALRKQISEQEKSIYASYKKKIKAERQQDLDKKPIEVSKGAKVHVMSLHQDGEVLEVLDKENKYYVQIGMLKMKIEKDDVVLAKTEPQRSVYRQKPIKSVDRHAMSNRLDLRGRNGEESLFLVEKMISDAIMSGTNELVIVHGKGTGKLRQVITAYLKDNSHVKEFRMGAPHEGGTGVTIVTL